MRKWAGKYNSDWPRVDSQVSALAGTKLHALAEGYLTTGAPPERHDAFGELFIEALPHLPHPSTGTCEGRSEGKLYGLPFVMVQDWTGPSDALPKALVGMPATLDHKTSIDPKAYGVFGRAKHLDNPQSLVYLAKHDASEAFGRWVYYKKTTALLAWELDQYITLGGTDAATLEKYSKRISGPARKPKVVISDVVLTREEIRGGLERIVLPLGEKLLSIRAKGKIDPLTLEPNPAECNEYGGCPFRDRCNLTTSEQLRGYMSNGNNAPQFNLMDQLPPVNGPSAAPVASLPVTSVAPQFVWGGPITDAQPKIVTGPVPVWQAPVGVRLTPLPVVFQSTKAEIDEKERHFQAALKERAMLENSAAIPLKSADLARYKTERLAVAFRAAFEAFIGALEG